MPTTWKRAWKAALIPLFLASPTAFAQVKGAWVDPPLNLSASQVTTPDVSPPLDDVSASTQAISGPAQQAEPRLLAKAAQPKPEDQSTDVPPAELAERHSLLSHQGGLKSQASQLDRELTGAPPLPSRVIVQRSSPTSHVSTREQEVKALAESYLRLWSASNDRTLQATPAFYGSKVKFHGRSMSFAALLAEKRRFVQRWPNRKYRYQPGTMAINCEPNGRSCMVRSTFDFDAANAKLGRRSRGVGAHELVIHLTEDRPIIVSENSRVLRREGRP
jgi:hypothetical protein